MTKTVEWDTSQSSGTLLTSFAVGPRHIFKTSNFVKGTQTITLATGPPLYYLSNMFTQYRGGLKLNIKIAKTDYHSGRIEIVYVPRVPGTIPSLLNSTMSLREIVDIREGNEITLDIPFLQPVPYLDIEEAFGSVGIRVVNELRCPETAAQAIQMLFFWSASDDFELAVPGLSDNTVNFPAFSPQMGESLDNTLVNEVIGNQPVISETMESASLCVGELFTSVRQLVARNCQIWFTGAVTGITQREFVWPFFTSVASLQANVIQKPLFGGDPYSYISPMYVFYRGSMRLTCDTAAAVGSLSMTPAQKQIIEGKKCFDNSSQSNGTVDPVNYFGSNSITPAGTALTNAGVGVISMAVPYYCKTPVSLIVPNITDYIPYYDTAVGIEYSQPRSGVSVEYQSTPVWYRSVGEDFQFTYFVGCPPVPLSQPTNVFAAFGKEEVVTAAPDEKFKAEGDSIVDASMIHTGGGYTLS